MGTGAGVGLSATISFILVFLIKVLFVLFIMGLVVGLAVIVKRFIFTQDDIQKMKYVFDRQKTATPKVSCTICGKDQNADWKVCPYCGFDKTLANT